MAKTVFIAHPISGDVENNVKKVIAICEAIHSKDVIPVFPSFTWRQYLTDRPGDKALAHAVNEEYFKRGMVDEVWFYGDRMSDGMREEAKLARSFGITVVGKSRETMSGLLEMEFANNG